MITAFPEGLRGALKAAAVKHYGTDADPGEVGDLEEAVLVFLNAALDAGVAREAYSYDDEQGEMVFIDLKQAHTAQVPDSLIIRTGP